MREAAEGEAAVVLDVVAVVAAAAEMLPLEGKGCTLLGRYSIGRVWMVLTLRAWRYLLSRLSDFTSLPTLLHMVARYSSMTAQAACE